MAPFAHVVGMFLPLIVMVLVGVLVNRYWNRCVGENESDPKVADPITIDVVRKKPNTRKRTHASAHARIRARTHVRT